MEAEQSQYARMTEKEPEPTEAEVRAFMGEGAWERLMRLEALLRQRYALGRTLKYPFGNAYGWSYRYVHKRALLLYVFFEAGRFCCTISINDAGAAKVEALRESLCPTVWQSWQGRYACGAQGGWVHHTVSDDEELASLVALVEVKAPPKKERAQQ